MDQWDGVKVKLRESSVLGMGVLELFGPVKYVSID